MNTEIKIPDGYEAKIVGNKVVFVPKESEDERIRKIILLALIASEDELSNFYKVHKIHRKECTDWLEKQKEQKPAEWSEEDESYLQTVINEMEANKKEAREYEHKKYDTIILWLKSLRPSWKPREDEKSKK